MPELPEVETTINELKPHLTGKKISRVDLPWGSTAAFPSAADFARELKGRTIEDITRRGKYIIIKLSGGKYLLAHLRMTGSLLLRREGEEPDKFTRAVIHLKSGYAVHFRDVRRFGRMWLVDRPETVVGKLGVEPLSDGFTAAKLSEMLKGRTTPVKNLILDQSRIAGIGNMYADEALHRAKLHPLRQGGSLSAEEVKRLHRAIREVLRQGIRNNGASTDTYFRPDGARGSAQMSFKVAHRKGEKCPLCSCEIQRIVVGQRGTYFCPNCQKLHRS
jgi:formamidopyrimidine-DNA glycosylase